jgi:hypothetical protein
MYGKIETHFLEEKNRFYLSFVECLTILSESFILFRSIERLTLFKLKVVSQPSLLKQSLIEEGF